MPSDDLDPRPAGPAPEPQAAPPQPDAPGDPAGPPRPPGEVGGHTVQPWEQDAVPPMTSPNSKDVPPPEMGTKEARSRGPGAEGGIVPTTAAPGNQPSGASPGHGRSVGEGRAGPQERLESLPGSEGTGAAKAESPAKGEPPALTRPSRPPVYKPQNGHEPAPRPPPAQVAQAKAKGPPTDGDALVEAITKAIAENLAKAFHQSVAQAVRDFMPLSGRSVAQPKVDVGPNLTKAPKPTAAGPQARTTSETPSGTKPKASNPAAAGLQARPASSIKPQEAKPAPEVDPSAQTPLGQPSDQPRESQYGGTIEPSDEAAKARLAAASNPKSPAVGQAAAESADRETREGRLA